MRKLATTIWQSLLLVWVRSQCKHREKRPDFRRLHIVADLTRANGIARGAELQAAAAKRSGLEPRLLDVSTRPRHILRRRVKEHLGGTVYVFHCGGPETVNLLARVLPGAKRAWRVGYWAWELPTAPPYWKKFEGLVDEVWTPSEFSADALRQLLSVPVHVVPHEIMAGQNLDFRPRQQFTVLVMADGRSSLSRKNPAGAIRAFRMAFGDSSDVQLVLKVNASDVDREKLLDIAGDAENISLVSNFLDKDQLDQLYKSSSVLLSLHRAEGYGLPLREAMANGLPVVATAWSGSMDFLSSENCFLVPYTLVRVSDAHGVYNLDCEWAEPDLSAAARALQELKADPALWERRARSAAGSFDGRGSFAQLVAGL